MENRLKLTEVAKILRCDPRTVKTAVRKGELKAIKVSGIYYIPETELDAYQQGEGSKTERILRKRIAELENERDELLSVMQRVASDLLAKGGKK